MDETQASRNKSDFVVTMDAYNYQVVHHQVHTMDHEVVPRPYRICNWLLNSSWDHFGLHLERKKLSK